MADLTGRVALVTGGSRGIGRAIALALAGAGADVAVNYRARAADAEAVATQIQQMGRRALAIGGDVSQAAAVATMVRDTEARVGGIDVLVNNAGIATIRTIDTIDEAEFDRTIAVNLKSTFLCMQAVIPGMRARRWGRIINISSIAARFAGAIGPHYNASKAGIEGLTRGYAVPLAKDGITVNAVAPGIIETDMTEELRQTDALTRIPAGRYGTPEEVADLTLSVIRNGFVTGQSFAINGGTLLA
jgi:3-oxoacyl-[acyl-carrier protein] reductase